MNALAIIPARGGSKGIPGKNLATLCGKPLIYWTIAAAAAAGIRDILVSTDDSAIAEASRGFGAQVPFLRPAELSTDAAASLPVVQHAIQAMNHKGPIILLQPTSPLRLPEDIRAAMELYTANPGRTVVSVTSAKPWLFSITDTGLKPAVAVELQRQRANYVVPNGAIYIADAEETLRGQDWFAHAVPFPMPASRSLDIDEPHELVMAEALMQARTKQP